MIAEQIHRLLGALNTFTAPDIEWRDGQNHYVLKTIEGHTSLLCWKGRIYNGPVIFAAHNLPRRRMRLHMNPLGGHFVVSRKKVGPATIAVHVTKEAARAIAKAYSARYNELDDYGRPVPLNFKA